jgi:hypothetical protein
MMVDILATCSRQLLQALSPMLLAADAAAQHAQTLSTGGCGRSVEPEWMT